jgi:hypothetical protein
MVACLDKAKVKVHTTGEQIVMALMGCWASDSLG